ncbi:hypothetical protein QAD02_011999 [Eretmocerus hayati]|uniref:Uncharacterized protein n=1 Tax=Eretmocerus hayati TaxID=131215 RepID=A0ACC2NZD6_9HYME|nr:hypothetical protein QAD02_011999 [Eretmocerus hayati]
MLDKNSLTPVDLTQITAYPVNDENKKSFMVCVYNTLHEFDRISSAAKKNVLSTINLSEHHVKTVLDAQDATSKILGELQTLIEKLSIVKKNHSDGHKVWLDQCLGVKPQESVIDLGDSSSSDELEIVNEVKYIENRKSVEKNVDNKKGKWLSRTRSTPKNGLNRERWSSIDKWRIPKSSQDVLKCKSNPPVVIDIDSYKPDIKLHHDVTPKCDESASPVHKLDAEEFPPDQKYQNDDEGWDNHKSESSKDMDQSNSNESNCVRTEQTTCAQEFNEFCAEIKQSDLLDEKIQMKCFVRLKKCDDISAYLQTETEVLDKNDNFYDKLIDRATDLSVLEQRKRKRHGSSSDDCNAADNSNPFPYESGLKKNFKKSKTKSVASQNNDSDSLSDGSSTDFEFPRDDTDSSVSKSDERSCDEEEERSKRKLFENASSTDSLESESSREYESISQNLSTKRKEKKKKAKKINSLDDLKTSSEDEEDQYYKKKFLDPLLTTNFKRMLQNNSRNLDNTKKDDKTGDTCSPIQSQTGKIAGRKNIRPVWRDEQIKEITKQALKDEENRRQRVAELNQQMQSFNIEKSNSGEVLILELNKDTKEVEVSVDNGLVKHLKPHQKSGVKFMWESCFESLERCRTTEGSGCILAHCMGLGKTFQTITLVHTLLTNKAVGIRNVLVVCPMNTLLNWADEFYLWMDKVESSKNIQIHELTRIKELPKRIDKLQQWHEKGGVMIISYEMYRSLMNRDSKMSPEQTERMRGFLSNPGADLIVCDEGHLLKNDVSQLAQKMQDVKTKRRIVLTGTPLQNNLNEYHCMVNFVKPNLLGTKKEFHNRFVNPITNGQYDNSNSEDVTLMKKRAHVLHRLLEGCVQRCDYSVLKPFLPPKQEYVIHIRLSDLQREMYNHFMTSYVRADTMKKQFFDNYNAIKLLFAHPWSIQLKDQSRSISQQNKSQKSSSFPNVNSSLNEFWWSNFTNRPNFQDIMVSFKLVLCFAILEAAEIEGDKLLIFSHSLHSLRLIEEFLAKFDRESSNTENQNLFKFQKSWQKGKDYFVLDGTTKSEQRNRLCRKFNDPKNSTARLFLISTKAGGLGINLVGANRVIIFDPSWNPSHDVQSIFRIYRFGQRKPCYVYRLLSAGTMEEKIYQRGVNKLALSHRVIDEQQISRHFRDTDLAELYHLEDLNDEPGINVPTDRLLADVLLKYKNYVYKISEHDTLLENKEEEELDEAERQEAWNEYEQEKRNEIATSKQNQKDLLKRKAGSDLKNGESDSANQTFEDIHQSVDQSSSTSTTSAGTTATFPTTIAASTTNIQPSNHGRS